jgi:hypothetical protein
MKQTNFRAGRGEVKRFKLFARLCFQPVLKQNVATNAIAIFCVGAMRARSVRLSVNRAGPDGIIYRTNFVQVVSARALPDGQTVLLQSNGTYTAAHSPGGHPLRGAGGK